MSLSWTTWTMIGGGGLALLGAFILWRTSDWDLKGAALGSAWTLLRRKRTAENPTELERRLREITAEATLGRRARRGDRRPPLPRPGRSGLRGCF